MTAYNTWKFPLMFGVFIGVMIGMSIWHLLPPNVFAYSSRLSELTLRKSNSTWQDNNNVSYSPPSSLNQPIANDFHRLIDLEEFEFVTNQVPCNDTMTKDPLVLILIHSAPENWQKRHVIRETWGKEDARARLLFLLGAVNTANLQLKLNQENDLFQDMVQGNFHDAYRNMTYKHVMALKWFSYFCSKAKFLLKTDDDVFINTPLLYEYMEQGAIDRHDLILCKRIEKAPVSRSYSSKWRVSTKEYSNSVYPTYCPGFTILYSADTVFRLYEVAQKTSYFWIDDVHITGTLAKLSNLTITPIGDLYFNYKTENGRNQNSRSSIFLFASPDLTGNEIRILWELVSVGGATLREFNRSTIS